MKNKLLKFSYFFFLASLFLLLTPGVSAAIRYPVRELEGCRNARECKLFCEIPKNTPACWSYYKYGTASNVLGVTTVMDGSTAIKLGIKFPIEELGNCTNPAECREFCRADANKTVCTDFAVTKKIQKTRLKTISSNVIKQARTELGCDSATSCHNYCRKPENQTICKSFGEKFSLIKKTASASGSLNQDVISKANGELGCSTAEGCKNLCESPENLTKCRAFAAKYGLGIMSGQQKSTIAREMIKSGLCSNEVECAAYCQKNPAQCPGFSKSATESGKTSSRDKVFLGPAGCRTEKECFEYCKANPESCPNFPKKSQGFAELPKSTPDRPGKSPTPANDEFPTATIVATE